ncbi:Lin1244/Lin1753 domain-containing protein [Dehalococcoides mccartyi]|uniref:Lin1244/Lin1753 domain-containing protein n=1 Tax=Dehalococcoides mccartyi TaxID=61435 RepID=UPI00339201F3
MNKNAYYFPHDCNAADDPKILAMRFTYKAEGYGWYWMLVEQLRQQQDYRISVEILPMYAKKFDAPHKKFAQFIDDCVNKFHLFFIENSYIFSESLIKRMEFIENKSEKAKSAASARWTHEGSTASKSDADAMQTQCVRNAIKENKIKENKIKVITPLPPKGCAAVVVSSKGVTNFVDTETGEILSSPPVDTPSLETPEEEPISNNSAGPALQVDTDFGEICKQYAANIGKVTSLVADGIRDWVDNYPAEWIIAAIKEAVLANVKKPNYISAILDNWDKNGFKAVPQNKAAPPPDTNQGTTRANVENQISIRVRQEIVRNSKSGQPVALDGIRARVRREVEAEYAERLVAK